MMKRKCMFESTAAFYSGGEDEEEEDPVPSKQSSVI